jgi:hypothetical protein
MRLQVVITVETVAEIHRPRWEDHPTRPPLRQLHIGFDGLGGRQVHLILARDAATDLFELLRPIIAKDRSDA